MANILVVGGGFAGVVAAETLARRLGPEHRITLVSRYLHHKLWDEEGADLRQGRFWGWAKRAHTRYWTRLHTLRPVWQAEE